MVLVYLVCVFHTSHRLHGIPGPNRPGRQTRGPGATHGVDLTGWAGEGLSGEKT